MFMLYNNAPFSCRKEMIMAWTVSHWHEYFAYRKYNMLVQHHVSDDTDKSTR